MTEQGISEGETNRDLRAAIQGLLQADLSDDELRDQLGTLLETPETATAQPTTDDAIDSPGYQ
jgi:hypothetical protein